MKKLCILTSVIMSVCYAQSYHNMDLKKNSGDNKIKSIITTIIVDTTSVDTFYQYVFRDRYGNSTLEYKLNTSGDTISSYRFQFTDNDHAFSVYKHDTSESTHSREYNQHNLLVNESYTYTDSKLDHSTRYIYNNQHVLVKIEKDNTWGNERDTLIYEKGLLKTVLHYEEKTIIPDSTIYKYDKKGRMTEYYDTKYTKKRSRHLFSYNAKGLLSDEVFDYAPGTKYNFSIQYTYNYYSNGNKKQATFTTTKNGEQIIYKTSEYNSSGELTGSYERHTKTKGGIRKIFEVTYY